ncbi:MAG TPA: prefoldin subunit alpha [Geobacterales bacterium]|nr:prefoldin subunit alpha [Geobacterales bacterium]
MSNKEVELNKKVLEYEYYRELLNSYRGNLETARVLLNDVENAINSFEAIRSENQEKVELYAPIGSGSFVKFNYDKNEKILVNIGAKVYVEYTLEQALDFLNRKKAKINEAINNTSKVIEELSLIIARLENEINELSEKK